MSLWTVVHQHRYGTTAYLVESDKIPTERQLVRCLKLDYEPDRDESLTVDILDATGIVKLDWQDGDEKDYPDA